MEHKVQSVASSGGVVSRQVLTTQRPPLKTSSSYRISSRGGADLPFQARPWRRPRSARQDAAGGHTTTWDNRRGLGLNWDRSELGWVSQEPPGALRLGCAHGSWQPVVMGADLHQDDELDFRLLDVKARLSRHVLAKHSSQSPVAHSARMERAGGLLPLSEGARLRWIGISTDFVPLTLGAAGLWLDHTLQLWHHVMPAFLPARHFRGAARASRDRCWLLGWKRTECGVDTGPVLGRRGRAAVSPWATSCWASFT